MKKRDTEQDFITAFWKLYGAKPIEKISIHELCRSAGYNRATFYNHFENIYALLYAAVRGILSPAKDKILSVQDFSALLQGNLISSILFTCFQEQDQYIELLFKRRNQYVIGQQIKKEFLHLISAGAGSPAANSVSVEILLEYQISAVLGVIDYWYQSGKSVSEQRLLQQIYTISSEGVLKCLKAELSGENEGSS